MPCSGIAEIKLGADAGVAQSCGELLASPHAFGAEHGDQHRAGGRFLAELAEHRERGLQPRDADGETGRRYRLAHEARHQPVVAPAAADRAESDGTAFVVFGFDQQFNFVDRAGVVFESADDGRIDKDTIVS